MNKKLYSLDPSFPLRLWKNNLEKKSLFDFKRSLKKALSGNYQGLLFPENILDEKNKDFYLDQSLKQNLINVIQILSKTVFRKKEILQFLNKKYKSNLYFNIVFEEIDTIPLKDIQPFLSKIFFTYIITKKNKNILFKKKIPKELIEKIDFYFPYKESFFDPFLTPKQVYKFIKKQGKIKAYPLEIYDSRIAQDMDLEPLTQPFLETKSSSPKSLHFSIIIPSYNSKNQLFHTLENLSLQNYSKDRYEIILVDDGSTDNTRQMVKKFMKQHPHLNLKSIYFPRVIERKPGDCRFRAGLARNLGVKHSIGHILAFLDADILVPTNYLSQLQKEHQTADLVLLKRYHLKAKAPIKNISLHQKELKSWSYIKEKNYWGSFYKKGFNEVKSPWKYVCTYGLSLSRKDFQEVGAFGKNFIYYGFEDIDLGYKLYKRKKRFHLSQLEVYHQAPNKKWQEDKQNLLFRQSLLSKTAKIFFYKHLDLKIYEEMKTYMTQKRGFYYFFPF